MTDYAKIYDFNPLYKAHLTYRKGQQKKAEVIPFKQDLSRKRWKMKSKLEARTYQFSGCDHLTSCEPKKRGIYGNVICQKGKGTHFARDQRTQIFPLKNGMGYFDFRSYLTDTGKVIRRRKRTSKQQFRRRLLRSQKSYDSEALELAKVKPSLDGFKGHLNHGNTYRLRKTAFYEFVLQRQNMEGIGYSNHPIRVHLYKRRGGNKQ